MKRSALLLLCGILGVFLGLGSFTFLYARGGSYFSNDPLSCVNCHVMREHYDGWQHSSHHAVAVCNDCHTPEALVPKLVAKARNGFWHSKGFTLQDFPEPIRITPGNAAILEANCIRCHCDLVAEVVGHSRGDGSVRCVHCHGNVGHGP